MLLKPFLTVHDVADLLQVKEATVRAWINETSLRAVKFGKEWRVSPKDLEDFVERHANRPADQAQPADPSGAGVSQAPDKE